MHASTNNCIRQFHRWISIAFTLTVAANFAALTQGPPPAWITYSPLLPLALLLLTGLYLFVLPYANRWRARKDERALQAEAAQGASAGYAKP